MFAWEQCSLSMIGSRSVRSNSLYPPGPVTRCHLIMWFSLCSLALKENALFHFPTDGKNRHGSGYDIPTVVADVNGPTDSNRPTDSRPLEMGRRCCDHQGRIRSDSSFRIYLNFCCPEFSPSRRDSVRCSCCLSPRLSSGSDSPGSKLRQLSKLPRSVFLMEPQSR